MAGVLKGFGTFDQTTRMGVAAVEGDSFSLPRQKNQQNSSLTVNGSWWNFSRTSSTELPSTIN